jgi:uncharacterized membrane protein
MKLSPEERNNIYEEEKARIESEQRQETTEGESTLELPQNIAGLLCYLAGWITGSVFLVIEKKNEFIRFHAIQSIIIFGTITIAGTLLSLIPIIGSFFSTIIGAFTVILWIFLMLNAYKGELYEVPIAGDVAMAILTATKRSEKSEMGGEQKAAGPMAKEDSTRTRNWRVFNYSAVIFRNVVLFTFLSFFYNYMAWYHTEANGSVTRLPMLTGEYSSWLPILITALILSTAANILFIIYEKYDKYWLSETIQIILNMIGIAVVIALVSVFPFDFSVIPNSTAVDIVPILARFVLILTAAGLGLRVLLRFIKLISTATRQ